MYRMIMAWICRRLVFAYNSASQLIFSHDRCDRFLSNTFTLTVKKTRDFRATIKLSWRFKDLNNTLSQSFFSLDSFALGSFQIRIETASWHVEYVAHLLDRKFGAVFFDKAIRYLRSFIKMRMAFFKIAFSSHKSWFSRSSSRNACASGFRCPLPTNGETGSSL